MGWPFSEASWDVATGAYYAAVGSEMLWIILSVAACVIALVAGSRHELDAYRKIEK